jgi:hypothetical protein
VFIPGSVIVKGRRHIPQANDVFRYTPKPLPCSYYCTRNAVGSTASYGIISW